MFVAAALRRSAGRGSHQLRTLRSRNDVANPVRQLSSFFDKPDDDNVAPDVAVSSVASTPSHKSAHHHKAPARAKGFENRHKPLRPHATPAKPTIPAARGKGGFARTLPQILPRSARQKPIVTGSSSTPHQQQHSPIVADSRKDPSPPQQHQPHQPIQSNQTPSASPSSLPPNISSSTSSSTGTDATVTPPPSASQRTKLVNISTKLEEEVDVAKLQESMREDWKRLKLANIELKSAAFQGANLSKQPLSTRVTIGLSLGGNLLIAMAKFYAYTRTGHSAMFSEAIHTLVDVGNQAILGYGLLEAERDPDRQHQYGYGRAAFFYSLVTALSTFGFGAIYTGYEGIHTLLHPPEMLSSVPETWAILGISLAVDGFVLKTALKNTKKRATSAGVSTWKWLMSFKDPFTVAVVFEDSAAVLGVCAAAVGIGLTQYTGNPVYDGIATLFISGLLGSVSLKLIQMNRSFILGRPVDEKLLVGVRRLIKTRQSVDEVHSEQSQWIGPSTFTYKAEVDFDGTWLAAQLYENYRPVFVTAAEKGSAGLEKELLWLLPAFAEDITRVLEREVRAVQREVLTRFPEAAFVEIVPDSSQSTYMALESFIKKNASRLVEQYQIESMISVAEDHTEEDHSQDIFNLGSLYLGMGQYEKAAEQFRQSLEQRKATLGESHPAVAAALERLGFVSLKLDETRHALSYLKQALEITNSNPKSDNLLVASVHVNLGLALRDVNQPITACRHLEIALDMRESLLDKQDPAVIAVLLALGETYATIPNKRMFSLRYYDTAKQRRVQEVGPIHASVADIDRRLVKASLKSGLPHRAIKHAEDYARALEMLQQGKKENQQDVYLAWEAVGDIAMQCKLYSKAREMYSRAINKDMSSKTSLSNNRVAQKIAETYRRLDQDMPRIFHASSSSSSSSPTGR